MSILLNKYHIRIATCPCWLFCMVREDSYEETVYYGLGIQTQMDRYFQKNFSHCSKCFLLIIVQSNLTKCTQFILQYYLVVEVSKSFKVKVKVEISSLQKYLLNVMSPYFNAKKPVPGPNQICNSSQNLYLVKPHISPDETQRSTFSRDLACQASSLSCLVWNQSIRHREKHLFQ